MERGGYGLELLILIVVRGAGCRLVVVFQVESRCVESFIGLMALLCDWESGIYRC